MKKEKTCKVCKKKFTPERDFQVVCDYQCGIAYAKVLQEKREAKKKAEKRVALREFKKEHKPTLKKLAQALINKYARLRDEKERGLSCCTCGKKDGKFDGGHFLPTSGYSAIRYNTNQIHLQCVNCNQYNGGRPKEYREFMVNKYGVDYVEKLESTKNVLRNYNIEYYQKLIRVVRKKIKSIS